jgi:hypothetical protein
VEAGGVLLVLGALSQSEPGSEAADRPLDLALAWGASYTAEGVTRFQAGLGTLLLAAGLSPEELSAEGQEAVLEDLHGGTRPWEQLQVGSTEERLLPTDRRPERGLFLVLALFALGVGPLALLWLKRRGRPILILAVVPVASFVTCGVLIAGLFAYEGIDVRQRIDTLTFLDQEARRAVTLGRMAFYAPFPPEALPFDAATQIEPYVFNRFRNDQPERRTDWSQGQRLERGWLLPRVPLHLRVRRVEERRERLAVEGPGAGGAPVRVVNGLGVAIRRLWLVTPDGQLWTGEGIAAGAPAVLEGAPASGVHGMSFREARRLFEGPWVNLAAEMAARAPGIVRPGGYLAEVERSPFVEAPLGDQGKVERTAVVYGFFAPEGAP